MFLDLYSVNIDEKIREGIDKYKEIGLAKKQLYSMPQYFRDRDRKGIKLPANKLQRELVDTDLIKVRGDFEFSKINQRCSETPVVLYYRIRYQNWARRCPGNGGIKENGKFKTEIESTVS